MACRQLVDVFRSRLIGVSRKELIFLRNINRRTATFAGCFTFSLQPVLPNRAYAILLFFILLCFSNCKQNQIDEKKDTLFALVTPEHSGIYFKNTITTSDSINILNYEYLYNGGGVGVGDFNNDSLPDIFFSGNMVPGELYINKGNFSFSNVTEQSGINTRGVWAYGVSVVDINQDGWQDIYLCAGGIGNKDAFPNKLYINQGNLTFKESAEEYGLADKGESIQAAFFDYDQDGDLDMYLLTGGGFERSAVIPHPILNNGSARNTDRLYRNDFDLRAGHPVFTNVSKEAGILEAGFGLGLSILDVNEDGLHDVYVTNDYLSNDLLYVNNGNGTFTEQCSKYFKHTSHFAMGNDVGDINNDGRMDIVAVDMLPENYYKRKLMVGPNQYDKFNFSIMQGYMHQYMRNTLQLNNGNGSFSEIGQLAGMHKTDWSWSLLLADLDNDTYQDIFITNGFVKDITDLDFVKFRNEGAQTMSKETYHKAFLDSLNVRPGILVANYAYKNNTDNTFRKVSDEWGFNEPSFSNGAAYADFDRDGDLDLVINNIDREAFLYRNNLMEKDRPNSNYLRIKLWGPVHNKSGLGSSVQINYSGKHQVRYHQVVRGFESSVEDYIHVGLGQASMADTIQVNWPDGRVTRLYNTKANQVLYLDYTESKPLTKNKNSKVQAWFKKLPSTQFPFKHTENEFNDFNRQPLLLHKLSQEGPGITVGDVNGDGLEDVFIGNAYRASACFFIQKKNGDFEKQPFSTNEDVNEDLGCLLFDADSDADLDLYVVSGGAEYYKDHSNYQDRLYINNGRGNFRNDPDALQATLASGSCVVAGDYDSDGDLDLFVGGRLVPDAYPTAPQSYILQNNSGKFSDVTNSIAPEIGRIGMVTSALWTDYNNDHNLDLVLVGEAMPISVFENKAGKLANVTEHAGLKDTDGFWNGLVAGDFDNDGDMDYAAGNAGLNAPYKASLKEPITIYNGDFDNNGSIDPLVAHYENGNMYPFSSLDVLTQQLPSLKKHILYYRNFAKASMDDLLKMMGKSEYQKLFCKTLKTSIIKNLGPTGFQILELPVEAQTAPVYGIMAEDINADGNLDLLMVGNSYAADVVTGRHDAFIGLALKGNGDCTFAPVDANHSGLFAAGDAKGIARIKNGNHSDFIITQNNDSLLVFRFNDDRNELVQPLPKEQYAILTMNDDKRRKVELSYGHTYLSQSSRSLMINRQVKKAHLFNAHGVITREIVFTNNELENTSY